VSDTIYDLAIVGAGLLRRVEAAEGIFGQATHLPKARERK
jgi:hypothetical protein